jgi:hypothetical protein
MMMMAVVVCTHCSRKRRRNVIVTTVVPAVAATSSSSSYDIPTDGHYVQLSASSSPRVVPIPSSTSPLPKHVVAQVVVQVVSSSRNGTDGIGGDGGGYITGSFHLWGVGE